MATYNLGRVVGPQGEPGETGNGIASTTLNQDYTLTINYTNGDSDTTSSIRGEKGETGAPGKDGEDYVITQADYQAIADVVESEVNIPTKTSDLTNDSGFITNAVNDLTNYYLRSNTYTKDEVNTLIGNIETISMTVVSELPLEGESNVIYLVPSADPQTQNVKDEYIWVNNTWEQIGSTAIDLTGYATETWVNTQIAGKENSANKVTSMSASSTDIEYPSAKAVYDALQNVGGSDIPIYPIEINDEFALIKNTVEKRQRFADIFTDAYNKGYNMIGFLLSCYYASDPNSRLQILLTVANNSAPISNKPTYYNVVSSAIFPIGVSASPLTDIVETFRIDFKLTWNGDVCTVTSDTKVYKRQRTVVYEENILKKDNTTSFTPTSDYNPSTKKYVDDNVGTKQDTLVSGTNIKTINNESLLGNGNINFEFGNLNYKGHVATTDDLPSTGQPSATLVQPTVNINTSCANSSDSYLSTFQTYVTSEYPYAIGGFNGRISAQIVVRSAYEDVFDYIFTGGRDDKHHYTHFNASAEKPVNIHPGYGNVKTYTINYDDGTYETKTSSDTITKPGWVCLSPDGTAPDYVYGNISHPLKIKNTPTTWYWNNGSWSMPEYTTFVNATTNYNYAVDYNFITFDSTTKTYSFIGADPSPDAVENAVYTVGDTYEIYRCNDQPVWEHWSISNGGGSSTDVQINGTSITSQGVANIVTETAYDASTNKIATMSDLPDIEPIYLGKTTAYNTEQTALNLNTLPIGMYYLKHNNTNNKLWLKATYRGNQSSPTTRTLEINLFDDVTEQGVPNARVINNQIILYIDKEFNETTISKSSLGSIAITLGDANHSLASTFRMINLGTTGINLATYTYEDFAIESTNNKVTSLSSSSTDTEYPSAKCVYDLVGDIESLLSEV